MQARDDAWIIKNRAVLESARSVIADHLGRVTISGSPSGAAVLINGSKAGTLPLLDPFVVPAGESVVTVEAPGRVSISRKINVAPRALVRETIDLPADLSPRARAVERPSTSVARAWEPSPPDTS